MKTAIEVTLTSAEVELLYEMLFTAYVTRSLGIGRVSHVTDYVTVYTLLGLFQRVKDRCETKSTSGTT